MKPRITSQGSYARQAVRLFAALTALVAFLPTPGRALDLPRESRVPGGIAILDLGAADETRGGPAVGEIG